ncbi:hypothetical protein [Acidisphaera sp. L21]|uniref:hypothetical protein n=1 Tax=Acidisphaera sp. L21 TaxID=1641851 RepID=UPI00131BB00B|nr:hypothetical protein [Acidisphaera sp. L21]
MPVNAATIECINAFQALLDVTAVLRTVQEHLSSVHQALTSEVGTFYFVGIGVEAVPAIKNTSRSGYDGRFWPSADAIQVALNQHAEAKGRVLRAYRAMPINERALVNLPSDLRVEADRQLTTRFAA